MHLLGPELPLAPAHRTHLQPSLRSLPSSQRSFARGRAGRGQGRGVPDRALAAGTCSLLVEPRRAGRPARTPSPRSQRRKPARYWPAPPALGPAGLKGDAAGLAARGVAPALAPPSFPHLAPPPPPRSVPQPSDRAAEFPCPGPSRVMRSGVGGVGHHCGSSIPQVWDPSVGERRTRPDLAWPCLVKPGPSAPPRSGF